MQKIIRIKNLDCAACAAELSEELNGIEGIEDAVADFINQKVSFGYADEEALKRAVYAISHFEEVEIVEGGTGVRKERHLKEILSIAVSAAFFLPALILQLLGGNEWVVFSLFLCSFAAAGWSVVLKIFHFRGWANLLDENLLMTIAAAGAFAIKEPLEGAAVMLLYQIGELLQDLAVGSSRSAITRLLEMKSDSAILLEGDGQREIDPEELKAGDLILIRKGDKVPADCVLTEGETALDTKSLTGEAYLREVGCGDELLSGCVNAGNAVKARVLRPVRESAAQKVLDMVENSSAKKAKPEKFITKFARIYTPVVVLLAVLIAVIPPLFEDYNFTAWIVPAIEFLVISCPCALIISVPLTYFSGVGNLARHGVLTKGAVCLDELAKVRTAAFDKTGTLTEGRFSIAKVNGEGRALALAAAAERNSSHPLAQAFAEVPTDLKAAETEELAGMGLSAVVGGKKILVGSARLMREQGVPFTPVASLKSVVYVAEEGRLVGSVEIEDKIRSEANSALSGLKACGIGTVAVLTGDTRARAEEVLKGLPVDVIEADLLPEQKPECARKLKAGGALMYVGDGINDTPVMAESDVSVAMGALGSDAAIEASDFVLAGDNLSALPKAVKGAKKTRKIVMQNIVFSIAVKIALMAVSVAGTAVGTFALPIWAAVFGDVGVMLLAVLNSMRMRGKL